MIQFLVPKTVSFTMREYLELWGRDLSERITIRNYEDLPHWEALPSGAYILAALDHLYPAGRRALAHVCDQLAAAGPAVRFLNSPEGTHLRLPLLQELHRRGWNRFRAVPATEDPEGLRFPVFLREEHWHTGALTPLLRTTAELKSAVARMMVRGHRRGDLLVVEFCDTPSPDGSYRKYSAFCVASEVIPRALELGSHWMVKHRQSTVSAASLREERAYVLENPHEEQLRRIFRAARVDYGRIDYSLRDGQVQTWEINLNPTIGRGLRPPSGHVASELRPIRDETKKHFYRRFQAALERIDAEGPAPVEIPIRLDCGTPRRTELLIRTYGPARWLTALRRTFRPIRPQLDRLVAAVSPWLVRPSRRAG